jgi:hypothetical protein
MKRELLILSILFTLFFTAFWIFDIKANEQFEMMIGFMSITIGFSVTALSVFASSSFAKELYKRSGKSNNKTQLHEFIDLFKSANLLFITNIALIFSHSLFSKTWLEQPIVIFKENYIKPEMPFEALIWGLLTFSIYQFCQLFILFCKYIIQSAK